MARTIIGLIHCYRWIISPFLAQGCRFEPTCSRYAINSIECHGLFKGLWLTIKRLLRCHPYEKLSEQIGKSWGYDPVPEKEPANTLILGPETTHS
ncbi:MAG: membrane protein insertion efficiency factor YidD [Alphaproteobacteria bacterium]|nr:membrane protein insertion efficiency factor YidD [Alphaproteobacteria bacterium]